VAFYDAEHKRRLVFLTNNFTLPALTIAGCERRLKSAARGGRKVQRWGWVESTPG
jgi:hypothetical protein